MSKYTTTQFKRSGCIYEIYKVPKQLVFTKPLGSVIDGLEFTKIEGDNGLYIKYLETNQYFKILLMGSIYQQLKNNPTPDEAYKIMELMICGI